MRISQELVYLICLITLAFTTAAYRHYSHPSDVNGQQPHVGAMYDWESDWYPLTAGLYLRHPDVGTIVP